MLEGTVDKTAKKGVSLKYKFERNFEVKIRSLRKYVLNNQKQK